MLAQRPPWACWTSWPPHPQPNPGGPGRQDTKAAAWGQAWGRSQVALSSGK